jgi:pheromone shutdown-related protein TraB
MEPSDTIHIINDGERTIYLIGTAHVSDESVKEVEKVIDEVQPDTVCVELDEARYQALVDENRWRKLDIFKVIREGKTLFLLANLAIGAYQRRLGTELGVKPGSELLAGATKADEVGAELVLIDRDIHTTLKRTWAAIGFWTRMNLLAEIVAALVSRGESQEIDIEQLKEKSQLAEMMKEFTRQLPMVHKPLIDERDQYLMSGIEAAPGNTIVAVVGAAHVEGMKTYFGKSVDRASLEEMPAPSKWTGLLKWLIPALIIGAFAFGYHKHSGRTLVDMLYAWVLPNSVFAALMTSLALARPLSILAAFIASPITSLNPLLPAGVVVGLVEATLRRPTVEDAEKIGDDVQSLSGIYKNQFTRVLLVAVMATIGSAMGAWIGLGWVYSYLGG